MKMPGKRVSVANCWDMSTEGETMAIEKKIEIPGGVTATMNGTLLQITGPKGVLERDLRYPGVNVGCDEKEFLVSTTSDRKKIMAMCGTFAAHARNMCIGVTEGFEYKMKVVYSHFPIQLKLSGNQLEIVNFLGEKEARFARVDEGVQLIIGNDEINISGIDKEKVGTTAARIERATRVGNRDPRVFQDGIYIVEKA
jgi:large subunit ribosomal protein L6